MNIELFKLEHIVWSLNDDGTIQKTWHLKSAWEKEPVDLTEEEAIQKKLLMPPKLRFQLGEIIYYTGSIPIPGTDGKEWKNRTPHVFNLVLKKANFFPDIAKSGWMYSFVQCPGEYVFENDERDAFCRVFDQDFDPTNKYRSITASFIFRTYEEAEEHLQEIVERERRKQAVKWDKKQFYVILGSENKDAYLKDGFTDGKYNYYEGYYEGVEGVKKMWYAILPDCGLSIATGKTRNECWESASKVIFPPEGGLSETRRAMYNEAKQIISEKTVTRI